MTTQRTLIRPASNATSVVLDRKTSGFVAVLEDISGEADPSGILLEAVAASKGEVSPFAVANRVHQRLVQQSGSELPELVTFFGVRWSESEAELCCAGPWRAHLLFGDQIVSSSRDHTVRSHVNDPAISLETRRTLPGAVTRLLGGKVAAPENWTWTLDRDWRIVASTKDFHQWRDPSDYCLSLEAQLDARHGSALVVRT